MTPLLSIITINYNNAEGLQRTIQSVLSQRNRNFQYIVIDGGSSDQSKEIIQQNARHIDYWVSEKDSGIYNAMNKGIAQATGKYCLFMNSGDQIYDETVVERVMPSLEQGTADYFTGHSVQKKDGKSCLLLKSPQCMTAYFITHYALSHPSTFIRTELLKQTGYNENYRIVSDWGQMLYAFLVKNATYQCLDWTVSIFDDPGLSADRKKVAQEREAYLQEVLPSTYLCDSLVLNGKDVVLQKRFKKIYQSLNMGGLAGNWKLLRNAFKWLVADMFCPRRQQMTAMSRQQKIHASHH